MLATIQNMIDRSLGKQPLASGGNAPKSNVVGTSHTVAPSFKDKTKCIAYMYTRIKFHIYIDIISE